jgi:membrane fusion protein, multidrug efflux system
MRTHSAGTGIRPRGFRKGYYVLPLIAFAALLLSGCSSTSGGASKGEDSGGKGGRGGRGGGAVPVSVVNASTRDVPVEINVIGNVEAYATVGIRAQVAGQLTNVFFKEGDFVEKGARLIEIDRRSFDATLNQASANAARDEATLGQVQANLARDMARARYSDANATRYAKLAEDGVLSRDQAEQVRATADADAQAVAADKAAIESAKAAMAASRAAVETARIQLGYTTIVAPIKGRTGALNVKPGNIVTSTAGATDLMTINQIEPIFVTFTVPEINLPTIRDHMARQKLVVVAQVQGEVPVTEMGTLSFVDNSVDATTGAIKLKATFANGDHKLWPGQFVRVTLRLTTQTNAVVVPNEAVQTGQDGTFVYVVKSDQTVESRPIQPGTRVDQVTVINTGLNAGEVVVTEGQLRLTPGARVSLRGAGGSGAGGGRAGRRGAPGGAAGAGAPGGKEGRGRGGRSAGKGQI